MYDYAVKLLVKEKKTEQEVIDSLINQGIDSESAIAVVQNLQAQIREVKNKQANKDMLYGALWCIGGTVVTFVSMAAAEGGGTYYMFWGAIIFGAVQFIRGAAAYKK